MRYRDTIAAPKYGTTPVYGECEAEGCEATARTTCSACAGEYCLGHASHADHDVHEQARALA